MRRVASIIAQLPPAAACCCWGATSSCMWCVLFNFARPWVDLVVVCCLMIWERKSSITNVGDYDSAKMTMVSRLMHFHEINQQCCRRCRWRQAVVENRYSGRETKSSILLMDTTTTEQSSALVVAAFVIVYHSYFSVWYMVRRQGFTTSLFVHTMFDCTYRQLKCSWMKFIDRHSCGSVPSLQLFIFLSLSKWRMLVQLLLWS
jgi:hypothetical protein